MPATKSASRWSARKRNCCLAAAREITSFCLRRCRSSKFDTSVRHNRLLGERFGSHDVTQSAEWLVLQSGPDSDQSSDRGSVLFLFRFRLLLSSCSDCGSSKLE